MSDIESDDYSAPALADRYCISIQQAHRYIVRFGPDRHELDRLLGAVDRIPVHRTEETQRKAGKVSFD